MEHIETAGSERELVIVQPHLRFGGAERQSVLLANALVEQGRSCTLILHNIEGGLVSELDPRVGLIGLGVTSHALVPLAALRLRRELRKFPDSYIIVKLWSSIMAAAMVEKWLPRHKFNYCEDLDPTDHATYISFGKLKQRIVGRIFNAKTELTANTHQVARSMIEVYGLAVEPTVISSAVDVVSVARKATEAVLGCERKDEAVNVLTVGSLIERKGLRLIFQALAQLSTPVRWHIVGEGPLGDWLRNVVPREGLDIKLYGGHASPYGFMRSADVLVHGASSEAFGIVILESIASGTPVIAADAIGPSEMVEVLGSRPDILRLFGRDSPTELAKALEGISAGPKARDLKTYIEHYDLAYTVKKWIQRAHR